MKQFLLGNPLGNLALRFRDKFDLLQAAWLSPEAVGMLANDQLATTLVTHMCLPGKTFIDVGAHIGSIISAVKQYANAPRIIAIEAIPEKVERLRKKFPEIELHGCAVGDVIGEVSFFVNRKQSGYSSLSKPANNADTDIFEIKVPIKTLDTLIASNDVDVIKIDVEGAELSVLRGGLNLLNKCRPTIMFESAPPADDGGGDTKEALYDFLLSNDYSLFVPNRVAHNDPGLTRLGFLESHLYPRRTTNYFAIPNERRAEIQGNARDILGISSETPLFIETSSDFKTA